MSKLYLLIAGQGYYPQDGTGDWIGCFATVTEAESNIKTTKEDILFIQGPRKGQVKNTINNYEVLKDGKWESVDWYNIIDLKQWID